MEKVYKSKIDGWLAAIILGAMAGSAWASIKIILTVSPSMWMWWVAFLTAGIGMGLPSWILLGTSYIIDSNCLRIKCGPFKWQVAIADITSITPTSSALSSPALSLDRLRINYGFGCTIMISPRDKEQFIQELEALRRDG